MRVISKRSKLITLSRDFTNSCLFMCDLNNPWRRVMGSQAGASFVFRQC
jgi:hypothetical protein